jgi:signal transduction histidine kinase
MRSERRGFISTKGAELADQRVSRAREARHDFLHRFFHDLATPLSAVALHLEGADRRVKRGADASESLAIARRELSRAFELFEQARESLLRPEEEPQTFGFDEFVSSTIRGNGASSLEIQGETGGRVRGDRGALEQALSALLTNALENSAPESISIHCEREGRRLRVRVENPGRLPAEDTESLFSPRVAAAGRHWGMGLPRARLFAARAGGTVYLEQIDDRVRAIFELPEETE